ncbi:hypothetical protein TRP66_22295 [Pseudomonas sp. JDS28PS106]|uniref:hypothetical protein n=1 Tax=Pseudomonas sp. JDS28PS106 TaxID=2497235 RepID=UPI002FCE9623
MQWPNEFWFRLPDVPTVVTEIPAPPGRRLWQKVVARIDSSGLFTEGNLAWSLGTASHVTSHSFAIIQNPLESAPAFI